MTWTLQNEVLVTWNGSDSSGKFWDEEHGGES
jgi:hypothetical protein